MKKIFNSMYVRLSLGAAFLVLLIVSIVPNLYLLNSGDGVVNARTSTITSPIEGILSFEGKVDYGRFYKKGERIGEVFNDRVNRSFLHELETERKTLGRRVTSMQDRIKEFAALIASLKESLENYQRFSAKQYEYLIMQEEFRLTEENAEYNRAKIEYGANKALAEKGAITKRLLEQTESNYLKSSNRKKNIDSRLGELKNSLDAVNAGAFLGDGHNDAPYSKQRMDQMLIEVSHARTAMEEAESRIEGITEQIENEKSRIAKAERFEMIAPFDCLVWRKPMVDGSTVVIDSELLVLLDCLSIFLDVAVGESEFSNIPAGDTVRYRMMGDSGYKEGVVISLKGSGAHAEDRNLAAMVTKEHRKEFRIWVMPGVGDLDMRPENYFQVGRRLEVKLPRRWAAGKSFSRFIDVF